MSASQQLTLQQVGFQLQLKQTNKIQNRATIKNTLPIPSHQLMFEECKPYGSWFRIIVSEMEHHHTLGGLFPPTPPPSDHGIKNASTTTKKFRQAKLDRFGFQKMSAYQRARLAYNDKFPEAMRIAQGPKKSKAQPGTSPKASENVPAWMAAYCSDSITFRDTSAQKVKMVIPEHAHDLDSMKRSDDIVAPPLPPSFEPTPQYQLPVEATEDNCVPIKQIVGRRDSGVSFAARTSPLSLPASSHSQVAQDGQLPQLATEDGEDQQDAASLATQQDSDTGTDVLTRVRRVLSENLKLKAGMEAVVKAKNTAVIEGLNKRARRAQYTKASKIVKRVVQRLLRRKALSSGRV